MSQGAHPPRTFLTSLVSERRRSRAVPTGDRRDARKAAEGRTGAPPDTAEGLLRLLAYLVAAPRPTGMEEIDRLFDQLVDGVARLAAERGSRQVLELEQSFQRLVQARAPAETVAKRLSVAAGSSSREVSPESFRQTHVWFEEQVFPRALWPRFTVAGSNCSDPERWRAELGAVVEEPDEDTAFFGRVLDQDFFQVRLPPSAPMVHAFESCVRGIEGDEVRVLDTGGLVFVPPLEQAAADLTLKQCRQQMSAGALGSTGHGIRVAILDTGLDIYHPAFAHAFDEGRVTYLRVQDMGEHEDRDPQYHGTHVAGIACGHTTEGTNTGFAPDAHLIAIRVFPPDSGWATTDDILTGLRLAVENEADIASMSLGGGGSHTSQLSFVSSELVRKDLCLVLAAAGNDGDGAPEYGVDSPSNGQHVLSVAALRGSGQIAGFSSRGNPESLDRDYNKPNMAAYGVDVVAPRAGTNSFVALSGTSMSTPMAAGFVASLLGAARASGRSPSPTELRRILLGACSDEGLSDDYGDPFDDCDYNRHVGFGLPTGERAMEGLSAGERRAPKGLAVAPAQAGTEQGVQLRVRAGTDEAQGPMLELGRLVAEGIRPTDQQGEGVALDASRPCPVLVVGTRGGGKSYGLGVVVEELATRTRCGTVVVDPIGIFWSLKNASRDDAASADLAAFGLSGTGLADVRVLSVGNEEVPGADGRFILRVADLNSEELADAIALAGTLGSPQRNLLRTAMGKVVDGYTAGGSRVPPMASFDLEDVARCIRTADDLVEGPAAPKRATSMSVQGRLGAASRWGVLGREGTAVAEVSRPGGVTVVDISHPDLSESLRSLVLGSLVDQLAEAEVSGGVPPTWVLVDEAHTLVPRGRETSTLNSVKRFCSTCSERGRGLVLATQRPAATHPDLLRLVRLAVAHRLLHGDDVRALLSMLPARGGSLAVDAELLRSLPVGNAVVADDHHPERPMLVRIRPRMTEHAGGAIEPSGPIADEGPKLATVLTSPEELRRTTRKWPTSAEAPTSRVPEGEPEAPLDLDSEEGADLASAATSDKAGRLSVFIAPARPPEEVAERIQRTVGGLFGAGSVHVHEPGPVLRFARLARVHATYHGGVFRGIRQLDLLIDTSTGEVVCELDPSSGLKRSSGLLPISKLGKVALEVVAEVIGGSRDAATIARKTSRRQADITKKLAELQEGGLLDGDPGNCRLASSLHLPGRGDLKAFALDERLEPLDAPPPSGAILPEATTEARVRAAIKRVLPWLTLEGRRSTTCFYPYYVADFTEYSVWGSTKRRATAYLDAVTFQLDEKRTQGA